MLYLIYEWWEEAFNNQESWAKTCSFLNLFGYITVRALLATFIAFIVSLKVGPWVIRKLVSLKIGQPIRSAEEVHKLNELHGAKAGTPTMGGVMILGTLLLAVVLCADLTNPFVQVTLFVTVGLGLLGFKDDFTKVAKKNSEGVSSRYKLAWQAIVGLLAALFIFFNPAISGKQTQGESAAVEGAAAAKENMIAEDLSKPSPKASGYWLKGDDKVAQQMNVSAITFPLFKKPIIDLWYFAIPFFMIVIIGASNAVNLTDGLDGLASGCTITTCIAYAAIAYLAGHVYMAYDYLSIPYNPKLGELTVLIMAMVGSAFGFLWFNCHPAKMFMGDTGSLAIGGCVGTMAICTKQEILLVVIGFVFVMEAMSVMLQVFSFKTTGKRIFKMAPIHHHFELKGWHEGQVIIRFWIISIICAMVGLALLKVV